MFFQIVNFLNKTHFKFHISIYHENAQYELTYIGGTWTKIKPILIANVDDNNKNSLSLSGNLTVEGTINGTASSAEYSTYNRSNGLSDVNIPDDNTTRVSFYLTNYETLNIPEFSYGGNLIQFSNKSFLTNQLWINNYTSSVYIRTMNAGGQSIGTWKQWERIYPDYKNISLTQNGYISFTNGLIIQWISSQNNGTGIINITSFPINFLSRCISAHATVNSSISEQTTHAYLLNLDANYTNSIIVYFKRIDSNLVALDTSQAEFQLLMLGY